MNFIRLDQAIEKDSGSLTRRSRWFHFLHVVQVPELDSSSLKGSEKPKFCSKHAAAGLL